MARIRIEDQPVAEDLTAEQEELIVGAGLKSFRPTLEGLEDRQLLASHLAGSLPVAPPVLDPAHVGLREFTADGDHVAGTLLMQGQRLAAEPYDVSKDGDSICIQARDRFEWEVVAELNIWGLREGASATWEKVSGDCIRVSIQFKYRIGGGPDREGLLQIDFTDQGPYRDR